MPQRESALLPDIILHALKKRWILIIICAFLGAGITLIHSRSIPIIYEATAQVKVPITSFANGSILGSDETFEDPKIKIYQLISLLQINKEIRNLCVTDGARSLDELHIAMKFKEIQALRGVIEISATGKTPEMAIDCVRILYGYIQRQHEDYVLEFENEALIKINLLKKRLSQISESESLRKKASKINLESGELQFFALQIYSLESAILEVKFKKVSLLNPIYISKEKIQLYRPVPISFGIFIGLIVGSIFSALIELMPLVWQRSTLPRKFFSKK